MGIRHYIYFIRSNLSSRPRRTLVAVGSVAVAIALFFFLISLGFGLRREIIRKVETIFPEQVITAEPPNSILGKSWITPEDLESIQSHPDVEHVSPRITVGCPVRAWSEMTGDFVTDVLAYGVDRKLVETDLPPDTPFEWDPEESAVPVLVSQYFLDLLKAGMGEDSIFSPFSGLLAEGLIGKEFTMEFGTSVMAMDNEGFLTIDARLIGYARNPSLLGVVVPEKFALEMNRRYQEERLKRPNWEVRYNQIHVFVKDPGKYGEVSDFLTKKRLVLKGNREWVQKVRWMTTGAAMGLAFVGLVILALASVNISNTFALLVMEKRREIGLYRAIGMTSREVKRLLLVQSGSMGLMGSILGVLVGFSLAWLGNLAAERLLPDLYLIPRSMFSLNVFLMILSVACAVLFSILATYPIAKDYSSRLPDELLK